MKILFFIFLLSTNVLAESYIIHNQDQELKTYLNLKKIKTSFLYNDVELKVLKRLKTTANNPLIVKLSKKEAKLIYKFFPNIELESIKQAKLYHKNEFEHLQWGLKNFGNDLKIPISDIKSKIIKGIPGKDINFPAVEQKDNLTTVAILDSGIDINHPDLKDHIYHNQIECDAQEKYDQCLKTQESKFCHDKWANFDGDQNGYPRDCNGYNVAAPKKEYQQMPGNNIVDDFIGHGTHVAGIIGAIDNKIGIKGVSQKVRLMSVKVSGQDGGEDIGTDIFAKGILYALNTSAKIINLSFGWQLKEDSKLVREMIELAHQKEVIVIAAAGNSFHDAPTYPCAYKTVICVGAYTSNGELADFSNFGPSVDILAPGEKILSTWPTHMRSYSFYQSRGYDYQSGTSMAAPFVTGSIARLLNNNFSYQEARNSILQNAAKTSSKYVRFGMLDLNKSLKNKIDFNINIESKNFLLTNISDLSFQFNITNTGKDLKDLEINFEHSKVNLDKNTLSIKNLKAGETKIIKSRFLSIPFDKTPHTDIKVIIKSKNYFDSKTIKIEGINIINPNNKDNYFDRFKINSSLTLDIKDFLSKSYFRITDNLDPEINKDLVAIQESEHTKILFLRSINKNFMVDNNPRFIKGNGHIISKVHKLDLNDDQSKEYALFVYKKIEGGYTPEFFLYDENLKPLDSKKIGLAIPSESVLGINLKWQKNINGHYQPLWIQKSSDPEYTKSELVWDLPEKNLRINRLLTLKDNKLKNIDLGCEPIDYLESNTQDFIKILCFEDKSFYREYFVLTLQNLNIIKKSIIKTNSYFSFEQAQNIIDLVSKSSTFIKINQDQLQVYTSINSEISQYQTEVKTTKHQKTIISHFNQEHFLFAYTSPYYIRFNLNGETTSFLKRSNNSKNDSFFPLRLSKNHLAVYRPANKTLGLSTELIIADMLNKNIAYKPEYRFIFSENITEVGVEIAKWGQKDTVLMLDFDNLELLRLNLSKELLD